MKVRFHLGKGQHFMKWQIRDGKNVQYFNPDSVILMMKGCKLHNNISTAEKIFNGSDKTVCAWVECESVEVVNLNLNVESLECIQYNPKISPHWRNHLNENIDNRFFGAIISQGKKLYEYPCEISTSHTI